MKPPDAEKRLAVHDTRAIMLVDDAIEWPIFDGTTAFLKRYAKRAGFRRDLPALFGLYPILRIFTTDSGRPDLYVHDPGQRMCLEASCVVIGPLEVVANTYGLDIASRLQKWCDEVGLWVRRL